MAELYTEWDSTLLSNPGAPVAYSRGCQPGYAAEFVPPGSALAVALRPNDPSGTWIRCRWIDVGAGAPNPDAAAIEGDTQKSWAETGGIITGANADTAKQVRDAVKAAAPSWLTVNLGLVAVIVGGGVLLFFLYGPRRL